jgi:hypothetical protein
VRYFVEDVTLGRDDTRTGFLVYAESGGKIYYDTQGFFINDNYIAEIKQSIDCIFDEVSEEKAKVRENQHGEEEVEASIEAAQ